MSREEKICTFWFPYNYHFFKQKRKIVILNNDSVFCLFSFKSSVCLLYIGLQFKMDLWILLPSSEIIYLNQFFFINLWNTYQKSIEIRLHLHEVREIKWNPKSLVSLVNIQFPIHMLRLFSEKSELPVFSRTSHNFWFI